MLILFLCRQFVLLLAALTFLSLSLPAIAHNIPVEATLQMFVKPEGHKLQVMIRVPLTTYVDAEYPRRAGGYVDLAKVDPSLRAAATVILLETLKMYEGDKELPTPTILSTRMSLDSDRSNTNYGTALAHLKAPPLPANTKLFWEQGKLDVLLEYPIQSETSYFSMHA